MNVPSVTIRQVWEARKRIACIVNKTPLVYSHRLSDMAEASVHLKLENMHDTGAFKVRGAANKILSLNAEEQARGVTTFSTGNHGQAVAYVAQKLGIKAIICISRRVPKAKVDAIRRWGAHLEIFGESQDEAGEHCLRLQEEQGLTMIQPFDDPYVIAGQGTIGLEILEDLPQVDMVISGLSGGGLLSGVGLTLKSCDSNIDIIGITMEHGAVMHESLKKGEPVVLDEQHTLADSLLGGIGPDNRYTLRMVQNYVDQSLLLSEDAIAEGMAYMLEQHRMAVEGAAAVGIGALLRKKIFKPGGQIVVLISGGNVDLQAHLRATAPFLQNFSM